MCGIFGVVARGRPVDLRHVQLAADSLRHRGPDGEGFLIQRDGEPARLVSRLEAQTEAACHLALAHRRLAIIDLETGQQPMPNEDGTVFCLLNGEIYNYRELRRELIGRGHAFRTQSDTEVICHGFEEWGASIVRRLEGMFAIALYDARDRSLWLFRDPLGIKPLYYAQRGDAFLFGSEIKALLGYDASIGIARDAVLDFFLHDQIPAPRTPFEGVLKLGEGQLLRLDCRSGELGPPQPYWEIRFEIRQRRDAEVVEEVAATLERVVVKQKVADVPVGTFLSGGIDSSLVTLMSMRHSPTKAIHLHSEDRSSEYRWAMHPAFGPLERVNVLFRPNLEDCLAALAPVDDLLRDASLLPTFVVSRAAVRNGLKVVLSGDGGDENFAGYSIYHPAWLYEKYTAGVPGRWLARSPLLGLLCRIAGASSETATLLGRYARDGGYLPRFASVEVNNLLSARKVEPASVPHPFAAEARAAATDRDAETRLGRLLVLYYRHMLNVILQKVDTASMANSLEVRVPLLDPEMVSLALSLSFEVKARAGGKWPLKAVAAGHFGNRFAFRPKSGFLIDADRLFEDRAVMRYLREGLAQPGLDEFLDVPRVGRMLDGAHGRQGKRLWRALMFSEWYRNWGRRHA